MKKSLFILFLGLGLQAQNVWFEPNVGQVKGQTEWVGHSKGAYLYITGNEVVYANKTNTHMRLVGAKARVPVEGIEPTGGYSNYFTGRDEKTWFTGIPHYARLKYRDVYPGIDLVFYGSGRNAEYDFIVKPGINPDRIELAFSEPVKLDHGDLVVGGLRQHRPRVLQYGREVDAQYRIRDGGVQVALGDYDHGRELTIDPLLEFASYLGGPGQDFIFDLKTDSAGFLYLAGGTQSPASPSLNPFQQTNLTNFAPFLLKVSPAGDHVIFFTVLATSAYSNARAMALSPDGGVVLAGSTNSSNFPLKNAFQSSYSAAYYSAWITKLAGDGRTLVYSSFLGGSNWDEVDALAVDAQGNTYLTGYTKSQDFPVLNAAQPKYPGAYRSGFVTKVSPLGALLFSTFLGGSVDNWMRGLDIAPNQDVAVTGFTSSPDFPFVNATQTVVTSNIPAVVVARLSPTGKIVFASVLGGKARGIAAAVKFDPAGNYYITGQAGPGLTLKNPYQPSAQGTGNAFLVKLDASGQDMLFGTYLGGSGDDAAVGLALDVDGNMFIGGQTTSFDFPLKDSLMTFKGGGPSNSDCFLAKFTPAGGLVYSTLFAGRSTETCSAFARDSGAAYVWAIQTSSPDLPVKNAFQTLPGGGLDGWFAKVLEQTAVMPSPLSPTPGSLQFRFVVGGPLPPSQSFAVGGGAFTPSPSTSWLTVSASGTAVSVGLSPAGLAPGQYSGSVSLAPPLGSPATVQIALAVLSPAPVLASIEPSVVPIGSDDTLLTLRGSGFAKDTILQVDGINWAITPVRYVDGQTLTFELPAGYFNVAYNHPIAVRNPQSDWSNTLSISVGNAPPVFTASGVTNAASFSNGPVAPGEIVTIFGTNLIGNVTFDKVPATIVYSSPIQISATVPYSVLGPKTSLQVGASVPVSLDVVPSAPGIFAAVRNGDGTVTLYATGCGQLTQDNLPLCQLPVSATVNGEPAQVIYAGAAPGLVQGANQINVMLPRDIVSGPISIVLTAGTASSKPFSYILP